MTTSLLARPGSLALGTAALAGLAAAPITPKSLGDAGLALPVVAVLCAVAIGLPLVRAERRAHAMPATAAGAAATSLSTLLLTLAAAAALAPSIRALGVGGIFLALLAWLAAGFARGRASIGLVVLVGAALVGGSLATLGQPAGWTALDPQWAAWRGWLGPGLLMGLVLAGVGLGQGAMMRRSPERLHFAALGVGTAAALLVVLAHAQTYEIHGELASVGVGAALALALATASPLLVALRDDAPRLHAALGLTVTLLLAGPGHGGLALWWATLLPIGLAAVLGLRALASRGRLRWPLTAGSVGVLGIVGLGWPGLPSPGVAALIAVLPVLMVWVAGTRALAWRAA